MDKKHTFEAEGLVFSLDTEYYMLDEAWERVSRIQGRGAVTRVKYIPGKIRWGVWRASIRGKNGHRRKKR